jgi:hypothetical protein
MDALHLFLSALSTPKKQKLTRFFLAQLRHILSIVQASNLQLISSSVLLVYDLENPSLATLKIIDFAHSHVHEHEHLDENYISGLASFISFIERLQF